MIEEQMSQLRKLENSILLNVNLFDAANPDDRQYHNQFETYQEQVAQNSVDVAMLMQWDYSDSQIESELRKNEVKISEIYHSTLTSIAESINATKIEIDNLKVQLDALSAGKAEHTITANTSGIVHMSDRQDVGVVVQAGAVLGSIAAANDELTINVFISANDRARVRVGNSVDIAVAGLMESVYGTINGTVVHIDSDITMPQGDGSGQGSSENSAGFFMLTIEPDVNYLVSRSGVKYVLSNGTAVEARIKYDEITYFDYLLESIGVLVR